MRGKKILLLVFGILLVGIVSAATNTCCERTSSGAWCQNVNDASVCDVSTNPVTGQPYRAVSSFCESTSYCKLGTCINQQEGTCIISPEIVCEANNGFWSEQAQTSLPQCKLGCCLVGDQAAFVTQVSCNRMASIYGLEVNYRADISNEIMCLASANPGEEGACTYTKNGVTNCERTTRKECQDREKTSQGDYSFHGGFLCSAQELETICAKSQSTICEGDDVYFVDTCGNLANIYDANRINEENYWTLIQEPTCTPSSNPGNKNSATCGDCDYYYGSMCSDKGTNSGNYICKSLDCESYTGTYSYKTSSNPFPKHGDTWCATDNRNGGKVDSPGSSYFRLICYNGEVTVEECGNGESGATRQMICAENKTTRTGNCKANIWQDCSAQKTKGNCENVEIRDCKWIQVRRNTETVKALGFGGWFSESRSYKDYAFSDQGLTDNSSLSSADGACVPKYSPGFERDGNNEVIGGEVCSLSSNVAIVTYARPNIGVIVNSPWECVENCEYTDYSKLGGKLNQICSQMGDCGVKNNYIGQSGINTISNSFSVTGCLDGGSKNKCQ